MKSTSLAFVLALLVPSAGCAVAAYGVAAGAVTVGPAIAPMYAVQTGNGDGALEMGYTALNQGNGNDDLEVEGGGGFRIRSVARAGNKRVALMMHGRAEAGVYGRDRLYGMTGADAGPGLRLGKYTTLGLGVGYSYGGYTQNAHTIPARLGLYYHKGGLGFRLSPYVGWRFGEADEYPAAEGSFGAGWNTGGADGAVILGRGGKGIAVGFSVDRQDDVAIVAFTISAALQPDH